MEWEPKETDISWTKKILDGLEINQDWMEGEMAFRRIGESTLALLSRTERAAEPAERVKIVLNKLNWDLDEEHVTVIPDDPQAAAEMMQKTAESWTCPECNEHLVVNMNLGRAVWEVKGDTNYVDDEGNKQSYDRWVVTVLCECGKPVYLTPDDYYLVAGEVNFYTWSFVDEDGATWIARVMDPEQIVESVDSGFLEQLNAQHLGTTFQGHSIPPHMRGTFCILIQAATLEEEEE